MKLKLLTKFSDHYEFKHFDGIIMGISNMFSEGVFYLYAIYMSTESIIDALMPYEK